MKVLLVDDEKLQLMRLVEAVKSVLPEAEILSFSNPVLASKKCKEHTIDIAFLDVVMPELNGLQLAKRIKSTSHNANIIFVTAYEDYALESFRIHASGYVLKPVNAAKIKEEIESLRHPIESQNDKILQIKCFGNFEIFHDGKPLNFSYKKSKEVFAYLIDREGSSININELNAVLWEEDHKSYLRNLIADIQATLRSIGAEDVFIKRHNECSIDVSKVDCDAYRYKANDPKAINAYRGEYMAQYPWAIFDAE